MPFAIVFLIGILVGICLAYYFADVAAMRARLAQLERSKAELLRSDTDRDPDPPSDRQG